MTVLQQRNKVTSRDIVLHYRFFGKTDNSSANAVSGSPIFLADTGTRQVQTASEQNRDSVASVIHTRSCEDASFNRRRLGLAVAKNVGNAVTRNAVKRRFRRLAAKSEYRLPPVCDLVMRAKPHAARQSYACLDQQLAGLFDDVARKYAQSLGKSSGSNTHIGNQASWQAKKKVIPSSPADTLDCEQSHLHQEHRELT